MRTIQLNDTTSAPWLAFGSGTALWASDASAQILAALAAGFSHVDTAAMYSNESSVGLALRGSPGVYVTTKLDKLKAGENVREALRTSLGKLGRGCVELYLVHMPVDHADLSGVWREMEDVRREGLARSIGVSNFQVHHLENVLATAEVVPAVNQIEYSPYLVKATQPLLEYCKARGIAIAAYGALSPLTRFPGGPVDPVLERVAARLSDATGKSVSVAQVLQLWVRKKGMICVTSSANEERVKESVGCEVLPDITDEEEREIDEAGAQVHHRVWATWIDEGL